MTLTLIRWMVLTKRSFNAVFAAAVGNVLCLLGVALLATIFGESLVSSPKAICADVVAGLCVSCVTVAFAIAPRYITGAHIGLISLQETLLGPLWVFVAFGEQPPVYTLAGGTIIIAVVVAHETRALLLDHEVDQSLEKEAAGLEKLDDLHGSLPINDEERKTAE